MRWLSTVLLLSILYLANSTEVDEDVPSVRIMAMSTVYNTGETKAIFCRGKYITEPLEWFSPAGKKIETKSVSNYRLYVESVRRNKTEDETLLPLIVHDIQIADSGNWTCRAGELTATIVFVVGEKVNITERNVTIEGEEGDNIRLNCKAVGHPAPVIAWYKNNTPIFSDNQKYHIRKDNSLEVKRLNHLDVGQYVCKVTQKALSYYTDKTINLSVQHKPILYNVQRKIVATKIVEEYAILNEVKNITCSAIANPPPTYSWIKRDGNYESPIDNDWVKPSEDGTSSILVLPMRNESYLGEYKCTATNSKGQQSVVFHVSLGVRPDPPDFVELYSANVTELTFNVTCSTCFFQIEDNVSPNPENLTIIGYSFQLVPVKENYLPDWDSAGEFYDAIEDPDYTLFTVGPLDNKTKFHARVRSRNAAGYSVWVDISPDPSTTAHAVRLTATLLLIVVVFVCTFY